MLTITNKESNHLAKIVKLEGVRKHSNADRLQCVDINFQTVITGLDAKDGDIYVYFPVGSKIDHAYLAVTNSYADSSMNLDEGVKGYFNRKGTVKATRLRGEKSCGYIVPALSYFTYYGLLKGPNDLQRWVPDHIGKSFDTINGNLVVEKYVAPVKGGSLGPTQKQSKKLSRLVDGQVHLHENTSNLRHVIGKNITADDHVTITYKLHGTSGWASNVLVKKELPWYEKFAKWLGLTIGDEWFDLVYGSRRVVKNKHFDPKGQDHYYSSNIWSEMVAKYDLRNKIPTGYTLYYEIVGYTADGGFIQKGFDYGCEYKEAKLYVYRVTFTNVDGLVYNLSTPEAKTFTEKIGLEFVPVLSVNDRLKMYQANKLPGGEVDYKDIINNLELKYNGKNCYMCNGRVPEEGVVIRKEGNPFAFEAFKLKSFDFLEYESKNSEDVNIEDNA